MHSKTARFSLLSLVVAILLGAVAIAIASPNYAFADETPSEDLPLDFIYVESRTIEIGDTQNVVVAFPEDGPEVVSATLGFGRVDRDELIESPSVGSSDNAFAFSLQFAGTDAVGNYQLKEIAFSILEQGVEREECIDLTSREPTANNTFTVVDSLLEVQGDPAVELTAYTIDDGGGLREVGSLDELNLPSYQSRAKTSRPVVVLDPGHGGSDPGAMSNGLVEKNLTLAIAKYCKAELSEYAGISVSMTREADVYLDLDERVDIAVEKGATLFVSIHINSGGGAGAEVWVPNKSSWCYEAHEIGDELGNRILKKLSALGLASRGNKFDDYTINNGKFYPDGSPADALAVIRYARENGIPGVLIEHGFIDNSHDAALLSSDYYLRQWGIADASAIAEQLDMEKAKFWLSGISLTPESGQLVGTSLKMKASVAGDVSGLSYKFVWHKVGKDWSDGNWGVIQEKSSSSEAKWTPTEAGNYEIICDVVGANGIVQSTTVNYRVSAWALSSVEASPSELQLGESVTVAPVVSGETAGLRYKYSVVDLETRDGRLEPARRPVLRGVPVLGAARCRQLPRDRRRDRRRVLRLRLGDGRGRGGVDARRLHRRPVPGARREARRARGVPVGHDRRPDLQVRLGARRLGRLGRRLGAVRLRHGDLDPGRPRLLHPLLRRRRLARERARVHGQARQGDRSCLSNIRLQK